METPHLLDRDHPSFGTPQAQFLFAIRSDDGAVRKLLLVEAKNPAAVAAVEHVLLQGSGSVSEKCTAVAVYRACDEVGMRSDLIDEVGYVDFMLDVVDPDKLLADPTVSSFFVDSLTDEERAYARLKMEAKSSWNREPAAKKAPKAPRKDRVVEYEPGSRKDMLLSAMVRMGFQKPAVQKWMESSDVESGAIEDQIRAGLAALSS